MRFGCHCRRRINRLRYDWDISRSVKKRIHGVSRKRDSWRTTHRQMQKLVEESMACHLTCPHTSSSSHLTSFIEDAQERISIDWAGSSWTTENLDQIPSPETRLRVCVTSTARPFDKRNLAVLCRFLCRFFVKSSLFKTMDHSRYALGAKTNSGKCGMPCVNGAQVYISLHPAELVERSAL